MFELSASAAKWFLPFVVPICLWVMYTDLKSMKILNYAVLATLAIYAVVGFIALPLETYLWRYLHLVVVLVVGFVLNLTGGFGAGDAKFAAVMAPFVAYGDAGKFMMLLAMALIICFALHRIARLTPLRQLAPDWKSWDARKFPMGTALGLSFMVYLGLAAGYGL